tara:strand:- start:3405 stop:3797 length:393 start_codon:yes stop_codon:yes gene_type:complete
MTNSINQPWAICDKFVTRYGKTWADLDFVVNDKIYVDNFKSDPLNCEIGTLHICNHNITMTYKDLINYDKQLGILLNDLYVEHTSKTEVQLVSVKGRDCLLVKHEVAKLTETISEALASVIKSYTLGLYL